MQRNRIVKGLLGGLLAVAMLLSVLPTLALPAAVAASATTWYVDDSGGSDFTTIQAAVAAASAGDIIIVRDGTYVENVIIDNYVTPGSSGSGAHDRTGLMLRSENGSGTTVVQSASTSLDIINISASWITIDGFHVTEIGASPTKADIALAGASCSHCTIINNVCDGKQYGISVIGDGGWHTISNNKCTHVSTSTGKYAIYLYTTNNNVVIDNVCWHTSNTTTTTGIYIGATGTGVYSTNNTIRGNTVDNFKYGINLMKAQSSHIYQNTISNNAYGVYFTSLAATNNTFDLNNFVNNTAHAGVVSLVTVTGNFWNSTVQMQYSYGGNLYTGYLGNYYSGYSGADADGNGIGDTAYQTHTSAVEYDNYPLMGQYGTAIVALPVAAFSADTTTGAEPLTVHFTDQSTGYPTSWAWDFENDGTMDSTAQNPAHTYTSVGTYTAKLTATNAYGSDDEIKTNYITVAIPTYTITASAGANGSIDPTGSVVVNEGANQSFAIAPATGYHVLDVLVDSSSVGPVTSYTFTNVTAAHTIEASFAIDTFTITASTGANGSIDPSGDVTVNYGDNQTFAMSANTGYHIADVLVDGTSVGAVTSYEFTNVTVNHTIEASFALDCPEWDLNGDRVCNIGDVVVIGLHWGETGTGGWIPEDLNSDGVINIGDVVVLGLHWGETW